MMLIISQKTANRFHQIFYHVTAIFFSNIKYQNLLKMSNSEEVLSKLSPALICELKCLRAPPKVAGEIGELVALLMGNKPTWEEFQKIDNVIDNMKKFSIKQLPQARVARAKAMVEEKGMASAEYINHARKCSTASALMIQWALIQLS